MTDKQRKRVEKRINTALDRLESAAGMLFYDTLDKKAVVQKLYNHIRKGADAACDALYEAEKSTIEPPSD